MSILLNIDTATEIAHVSLSKDGVILQYAENSNQKDHAAFLQIAIDGLLKNTGILMAELDAVAVTSGPGSYTGLRVGMASAKGICYAINKPLILINTLEVLTVAAHNSIKDEAHINSLLCPMLDARRMEVYTAVYNNNFDVVISPAAMVLNENSFVELLTANTMFFFGSGSSKWKTLCTNPNAVFVQADNIPSAFAILSDKYFRQNIFADLAYSQPAYLKEFHDTVNRIN